MCLWDVFVQGGACSLDGGGHKRRHPDELRLEREIHLVPFRLASFDNAERELSAVDEPEGSRDGKCAHSREEDAGGNAEREAVGAALECVESVGGVRVEESFRINYECREGEWAGEVFEGVWRGEGMAESFWSKVGALPESARRGMSSCNERTHQQCRWMVEWRGVCQGWVKNGSHDEMCVY